MGTGYNNKFSAAPSLAGYLFQCRYALYRSLQLVEKSTNSHVAIERYDDISFENANYAECLIQAKHSNTPKSLSDNSVDLWKTIRVWLHERAAGSATTDSTRYNLITNSEASDGSAMSMLRPYPSQRSETDAYVSLKKAAETSTNLEAKEGHSAFLKLTKEEAIDFLSKVEIFDRSSGLADVRYDIVGKLKIISEEHAEDIANELEGWWLNVLGEHLTTSNLAPIPLQQVLRKANDIGDQYKGGGLPVYAPEDLGAKAYSVDDEAFMFVRQMRVVEMPESSIQRGVQDFYRASAQRARWARESLLLDGEGAKFDTALCDSWGREGDALRATSSINTEEEKKLYGRMLCAWASRHTHPFRNVVEAWMTSGSYHALSDKKRISWHPEFITLLAKKDTIDDA
ncbi:ABC-three component system protein [Thalassospira lucentensis]|mgnify:CR=1 FL=1|nr:ABC-three component system protein [Thalassospira lucentensis]